MIKLNCIESIGRDTLKLLLLSFYYSPDLCAGSFRCKALVDAIKAKTDDSVEIEIITTLPNRYASFTVDAQQLEQNGRVRVHRVALPAHQSGMVDQAKAFLAYARAVHRITRDSEYDLVFATSSRLMTAALGAWIARRKKRPLYLDIRDIFVDTIGEVLPAKLALVCKPIFSLLENWTFKRAQRINLVSRGFAPYFSSRYPKQPLSFFSNGIDAEFLDFEQSSIPSAKRGLIQVLYAGNIGEGQGLHAILPELAKRMENRVHFKILGDGGRKAKLEALLIANQCTNVELLPPVERAELVKEYHQADVLFLHLNDYEAFRKVLPSKIFEYAATGKPIWAGIAGYAAEFVKTEVSNAAVFEPCNSLAAEAAFEQLLLASELRDAFVSKFRRQRIMEEMAEDIISS